MKIAAHGRGAVALDEDGNERPLRVFIYARKSDYKRRKGDPAHLGRSVEEQVAVGRKQVAELGAEVAGVFIDDSRSATRYASKVRTEYERLISELQAGNGDMVWAWASSRLQRDLRVYVELRDICWEAGVLWYYGSRIYDLSRREDRLATGLDALIAEDYAEAVRTDIIRALDANAENGKPHGPPATGYLRVYDLRTGDPAGQVLDRTPRLNAHAMRCLRLVAIVSAGSPLALLTPLGRLVASEVIPRTVSDYIYNHVDILREAKDRVLSGTPTTVHKLQREFDQRGVVLADGGPWEHSGLRAALKNPAYAGIRMHKGKERARDCWEKLWSVEEHHALVAKLRPTRKGTRPGAIKYLLTNFATCGVCGAPAVRGNNTRHPLWHCDGSRMTPDSKRFHVGRNAARLEANVTQLVLDRLARPDVASLFSAGGSGSGLRLKTLLAERDAAQAQLDGFYEQAALGKLTPQGLAKVEGMILEQIQGIERRIDQLQWPPQLSILQGVQPEEIQTLWDEVWDLGQKRAIIGALFEEIAILPIGKGKRTDLMPLGDHLRWKWRRYD